VRLRGRDPEFVVALPEHHDDVGMTSPGPRTPPPVEDDDGGGTARVTLRLAEQLKARIEEAAALEGVSVNAWLVRSLSASLGAGSTSGTASRTTRPAPSSGQRYSGWAR
jgi:hypothetical protein